VANPEHLAILQRGIPAWNSWRKEYAEVVPDLAQPNLISLATLSVLPPFRYDCTHHLLASLKENVIDPVKRKAEEIAERRKAFETRPQT